MPAGRWMKASFDVCFEGRPLQTRYVLPDYARFLAGGSPVAGTGRRERSG